MNNLKKYSDEEILRLINDGKISVADIVDSGICPTCFDKNNNYTDKRMLVFYQFHIDYRTKVYYN